MTRNKPTPAPIRCTDPVRLVGFDETSVDKFVGRRR